MINEFLEERYPEPPLLPADPAARAAARLAGLPRRRLHQARTTPSGGGRTGAEEAFAAALGRARRDARRDAVPHGCGVRSRRHRARAVGDPRPRHAGRLARAVPARRRLARAPRRAAVDRGRDRGRRRPVSDVDARRARARGSARTGSSSSTCARRRVLRRGRLSLRRAPGPPAGRAQRRAPASAGGSRRGRGPGPRRRARGLRGDRVLPLRRPLGDGRAAPPGGGLRGAELRRLVARVVVDARRCRSSRETVGQASAQPGRRASRKASQSRRPCSFHVPRWSVRLPRIRGRVRQLRLRPRRTSGRACGASPRDGTARPTCARRAGRPGGRRRSRRGARRPAGSSKP